MIEGKPASDLAIQDAFATAVAIAVAPEKTDDAVQDIPPDHLLAFIWVCEELVRRLNVAKKGAQIEAQVALEHSEITPMLTVNGHRHIYRQDSRNDFDDVPLLFQDLVNLGFKPYTLARAIGYLRVMDIQRAIADKSDDDVKAAAYALIEEHRTKKPTGWALVDLDSPYRTPRKRISTPSQGS